MNLASNRFIACCVLSLLAATVRLPLRAAPPAHATWELTFQDEFNGSSVDWKVWESENGPRVKLEGRWPENNLVKDGILYQLTKKENPPRGGRSWSTAHIWTRAFAQQYGYFEVRMRYGRYLNNAFWLYRSPGKKFPDPPHFEIDMEGHTPRELANTLHFYLPVAGEKVVDHHAARKEWNALMNLDQDFHLYAFEWNERELIWYFDDRPVRRLKNPTCHAPAELRLSTVIMTDQLERDRVSPNTMDGVSMAVDWVRVYRKKQDLRAPNLPPLEVYEVPKIVGRSRQVADSARKAVLFREDFESVAAGTLPRSWEIGSGRPAVAAATGTQTTRALRLAPGDYVWRMFGTPIRNRIEVEFDYSTPDQGQGLLLITLGNFDRANPDRRKNSFATGDVGAYINWTETFVSFYTESDKWTHMARRKPAVWNHARFVLDVGKGVFDYYDGPGTAGFKSSGNFRHRQKAAHGIGLRHHGGAGLVQVDNIVVRIF